MSTKKHLRSQGKEIIAKVYHRMKYEAENGVEKLTDARWRTAQAVGYSEHTISNILKEERQAAASTSTDGSQKIFKSPSKRKRVCPKSTLDDFDISVLRRTIMSFHAMNEKPTLKKLKQVLSEKIGFDGCIETLRTILRESGYEWSTTDDNRKILVEKHDIQMLRFKYLTQLKKYRDEGRYIVFAGERYVHTSHIQNKCWKSVKGVLLPLKKKSSKEMPIIINHAGGCQGFVPNACLIYKANPTSDDYQDNMNVENYKIWLTKKLLPNLPENAVIVMDNASYKVVSETFPNPNSNKNIMQAWLTDKNIPFEQSMKKIELYDLILKNENRFKSFTIDELVRTKGFEVLRLPPYHPDLNPIEKILWGILQNYVAKESVGQNVTPLTTLLEERIEMIDSTIWENTCRQVDDIEKQYMKNFDMDFEFIINVESDSDESD